MKTFAREESMTKPFTKASPTFLARITGVFFLLTILMGVFSQAFVSERLINFGDAAATANNKENVK